MLVICVIFALNLSVESFWLDQYLSDFPPRCFFSFSCCTRHRWRIPTAIRLSIMRSRPESCGKDSHETPYSIDGECLCCVTAERLLLARSVDSVWWLPWRMCHRRLRPWRMPSRRRLQPGSWHDSDRFPSTGTSRHFTIHTAAGGLPTDDAADDRNGLAANLPLSTRTVPPVEHREF